MLIEKTYTVLNMCRAIETPSFKNIQAITVGTCPPAQAAACQGCL
jgi:hypothetical protein